MSSDSRLVEVARLQQTLRSLLRCPICLDLRRSSATSRCGHSFCHSCISDWIKVNGTRGKVKCPACQEDGVTRRSLANDNYGEVASMVDSLFKAGLEDTNGDIDFLSVRTVNQESRESASSPSFKNSSGIDDTIRIKEANCIVEKVVDVHEKACKEIQSVKVEGGKLWNKGKTLGRKTYSRGVEKKVGSSFEKEASSSPALPGEDLSGDEEWNSARRRRGLPRLPVCKDRMDHWLDGSGAIEQFVDPASQPSSSAAVSTPSSGVAPSRTFSNMMSPLSTGNLPLTQLDTNKVMRKAGQMRDKLKRQDMLWDTLNKKGSPQAPSNPPLVISEGDQESSTLSQVIPNSCQVDINDTFDKLIPEKPKPKAIAASPAPSSATPLVLFDSQMCSLDESLPALLSPQTSHNLIRSLESPGVMEMEDNRSYVSEVTNPDLLKKDSPDSPKELGLSAYLANTDATGRSNRSGKRVSWQDQEEPNRGLQMSRKKSPGWRKAGVAISEMSATTNSKYPCLDTTTDPLEVKKEAPETFDIESVDSSELPSGYATIKKNTSDGLENLLLLVSNATETYRNRAIDVKENSCKDAFETIGNAEIVKSKNSAINQNTSRENKLNSDKITSNLTLDSFPSVPSASSEYRGEDSTFGPVQQLCDNMVGDGQHGGSLETEVAQRSGSRSQQGRRATFSLEVDTLEMDRLSCPPDTLEMVNYITTTSPPDVPDIPQKILPETSQKRLSGSGFRSLVVFSRLGRTQGQTVAHKRERPVALFLQLGRLSSPCSRGPALRSLRQILARSSHCGESEVGDMDTTPGHRQTVVRWISNLHTPDSLVTPARMSNERQPSDLFPELDNSSATDNQTSSVMRVTTGQVLGSQQYKSPALICSECPSAVTTVSTRPLTSLPTPMKSSSGTMTSRLVECVAPQLTNIVSDDTDREDNLEPVVGFDRKGEDELREDELRNCKKNISYEIEQPVEVQYGTETLAAEISQHVTDMETESSGETSLGRTGTKSGQAKYPTSHLEQHISQDPISQGPLALNGTRTSATLSKRRKKVTTEEMLFSNPEPGPSGLLRKATRSNTRKQVRKVVSEETPEKAVAISSQSSEDSGELPGIEREKSTSAFMSCILGPQAEDLYSQDRETLLQQQERVAKQQFEEENMLSDDDISAENKKRGRDFYSDLDESPAKKKKMKKLSITESDEESDCIDNVESPAAVTRPGLCRSAGGPNFLNTFSSSSQQKSEKDSPSELIETVESQNVPQIERVVGSDVDEERVVVTGLSESTSLLDTREVKRSATLSRSSSAGSLTSDSEADPRHTQEMLQELARSEDRARKMRSEMESQEEGAVSQDFNEVVVLKQDDSASYPPLETEEANIETCAIEESEEVTDMNADCRTIPDSDDDLFSQTPEETGSRAPVPVKVSCLTLLETVTEEPPLVQCPDTTSWRMVTSNLSIRGRELMPQFLTSLGCRGLYSRVDETVTHLIVSTSENMEAQRTLKYLQAVTSGLMIVSDLWVEACLTDRSNLGRAEKWEVTDEELGGCNGPWGSRQRKEMGRQPLLKGFEVLVRGDLEGLDRASVEDLLDRAGARAVQDQNAFSFTTSVTRLVLVDSVSRMEAKSKEVIRLLRTLRLVTVDKDWLLDTLCAHSLRPIIPGYTLETVTKEDLVRAGYGYPLVPAQL